MENVAVYWDFENIHASLCTVRFGESWYRSNRYQKQPEVIDVDSVMEFIASLGNVNINKAYANWGYFYPYNSSLQNHAIDLLQLFPRGSHSKNGADIRMAIDIIEDLSQNSHITIVVVVAGDSDYISVAQKVRQRGRRIVGIGVRETTNQFWIRSCNEFKFYASLMIKASAPQAHGIQDLDTGALEEAKELLCKAVAALSSQTGGGSVVKAAVKPMMTRLDSSFDEANYGYTTFSDFLDYCRDVVTISHGQYDHLVTLKESAIGPGAQESAGQARGAYVDLLRRQQIRLVSAAILETGAVETYAIFLERGNQMGSYAEYKSELLRRLRTNGMTVTDADASKLKTLCYKAFVFNIDFEHGGISLSDKITSADALVHLLRYTITKRILDNIQGDPDSDQLSDLLFGEPRDREVATLVEEYRTEQALQPGS